MPNLSAHIALALEMADRLCHPAVERHRGAYVLGATAPDIRIITRWTREQTHFAPLDSEDMSAGVQGLFQAHPQLACAAQLGEATRAFVVGYVSHLVADQAWVVKLYRPFFGNGSVYQDHIQGNMMDRALQLEMDREGAPHLPEARLLLANAEDGVEVGFIDPPTLRAWREWVQQACERGFTWDRLRGFARRQPTQDHTAAQQFAEVFLQSVPEGLERIYQRVPLEQVVAFREKAIGEVLRIARRYLA
ncbi:MAG: hypothetical protein HY686_02530 [Chloroflexi bacterium]|nr:hypothetical protein [Chloroflexota bacterium]